MFNIISLSIVIAIIILAVLLENRSTVELSRVKVKNKHTRIK
jgi:hypothetical protein